MTHSLRLIHDGARHGPVNMAWDEALLKSVGAGDAPPTLRTYRWVEPTISLGYFQKYAEYTRLTPPVGGLPVVRRQTGGGAILHDHELTYSIALPLGHALLAPGPTVLYELAHDALIECLREHGVETNRDGVTDGSGPARGPFFCFARRHRLDVLLGPDKLAGSAQRRTGHAVLQHGSIMFESRFTPQPGATIPVAAGLTPENLGPVFAETFARPAKLPIEPGEWSAAEQNLAQELHEKYAGENWTRRV
ncbi:MAG: lipoate--protein ligase family protein [bacterium]|nr:lipoate--protein ligase family protein [bacterium]